MTRDTSLAAYDSMGPDKRALKAAIHLQILGRRDQGATCEEMEIAMRLRHQTCSARINELMKEDKIVDSGKRRINTSGRAAIVWLGVRPEENVAP